MWIYVERLRYKTSNALINYETLHEQITRKRFQFKTQNIYTSHMHETRLTSRTRRARQLTLLN